MLVAHHDGALREPSRIAAHRMLALGRHILILSHLGFRPNLFLI
jgi:hypothetical protein